jgi:hypothetical protein
VGVGIAQGYATLGKIGFEGRFDYGAIGTVTNLAARLCAEADGGQILISQRVYAAVEDSVVAERLPDIVVKGFLKPVTAFNVSGLRQSMVASSAESGAAQGDGKAFDDAVRRALAHLSDPPKMTTSPLLDLMVVTRGLAERRLDDNRLNRAAVLKDLLLELLEGLRPHEDNGKPTDDACRFYNCLYYPYVRGIGRRRAPTTLRQLAERRRREGGPPSDLEQVLDWLLQVDEDTFYKWQRRGSDTIAAALRERETAAGGMTNSPG